jgi:hypothetical protein
MDYNITFKKMIDKKYIKLVILLLIILATIHLFSKNNNSLQSSKGVGVISPEIAGSSASGCLKDPLTSYISQNGKYMSDAYLVKCNDANKITQVELSQSDSKNPQVVLAFSNEFKDLNIEWMDNNHLSVNYHGPDNMIIKYDHWYRDVEITLLKNGDRLPTNYQPGSIPDKLKNLFK